MIYWKVSHEYKLIDHIERKDIGIYSSLENAEKAVATLKTKNGFKDTVDGFRITKVFTLFKPHLLDNTYWVDGFDTYYFNRHSNEICCDKETNLMKHFTFLLTDYKFKFDKLELGDLVDETGKRWFYGPYNCYYFYNDKICINFTHLVQRQDWDIYITEKVLSDQNLIRKGKKVPTEFCYNWSLFASAIKDEVAKSNSIFGIRLN